MTLEQMWAGWRSEYLAGPTAEEPAGCVFCRILDSGATDRETHIVWRHPGGEVVAILNAYPYTSGHLMVMPVRHTGELESLSAAEAGALMEGLQAAVHALKVAYQPGGVNVGANLGKAAGAGVPGHLHLHVLPRWAGDTNFMTSVADTRVLPEALSVSDAKLRAAWPADGRRGEAPADGSGEEATPGFADSGEAGASLS